MEIAAISESESIVVMAIVADGAGVCVRACMNIAD